jgi:hypothetical protein
LLVVAATIGFYLDLIWTLFMTMANCFTDNSTGLRKRPENWSKLDSVHSNKRHKEQHDRRDEFASTCGSAAGMEVDPSSKLPSTQSIDSSESSSTSGSACYASVMTSLGFKMADGIQQK